MIVAEVPSTPPARPATQVIVVSRRESTQVVASSDQPLVLTKGPQREQALVRQAIFVTTSLSVTRPAVTEDAILETYRWTHQAFLQRQVCVSSIAGLFACTEPAVVSLPDKEAGEAPVSLTEPDAAPLSEAAYRRLADGLRPRAPALFDADRRRHVDPVFKAAGVIAARPATARR